MHSTRIGSKPKVKLPDSVHESFVRELLAALPEDDGVKTEYLKENLLSKYLDTLPGSSENRRNRAIEKWLDVEQTNRRTNERLYRLEADFGWTTAVDFVDSVRSLIGDVLGPLSHEEVFSNTDLTNGASTRVRRSPSASLEKLLGGCHVSSTAVKFWQAFAFGTRLQDRDHCLREESDMFTVPKKSDIDRVACKEPELNMLLQRGLGITIRNRLRDVGIDLQDQSRNRDLARKASITQQLATVDLSSASDTITRQLVLLLLPFEWWSMMDDLRVKQTRIGDEIHDLEMFSSMGNGFTFELESLLFYCIVRTINRKLGIKGSISVYGDDIICPVETIPVLKTIFSYLGFKVNMEKTSYTGTFRESCGGHYDRGFDVSPFFIRRRVATLPDLINLLNQVLEWDGRYWGCFTTPSLAKFHRKWARWVPKRLHGGIDPQDPTCLVTGDPPRDRLVPVTKRTGVGVRKETGLDLWLYRAMQQSEKAYSRLDRDPPKGPVHQQRCVAGFFLYDRAYGPNREESRLYDAAGVQIDPRRETGFKFRPVIHRGERTTWSPYVILHTDT